MSLILDALRKAEAERQRGSVPGLHDMGLAPRPPQRPPLQRPAWALALGLGVVLIAGLATWAWLADGSVPDAAQATLAQHAASPAAGTVPGAAANPSMAPLPQVVSAPTVPVPAPATPPAPAAGPTMAPLPQSAPAVVLETPPAPATATPRTAPAPILTQVRRLAELPPEQRRELPPLQVSGSVWSEQAAARFVVLDGQVLREGDAAAPGLVLVKLAPRAATLRWRDALIEVPF